MKQHEVVGAAEAKELLGVEIQRITRWRREGKLPPPIAMLASSPIWRKEDILLFIGGMEAHQFPDPPSPSPYLGTAEAASMVGVDKSQLGRWRRKPPRSGPPLPMPVAKVRAGPLWLRSDIEDFVQQRNGGAAHEALSTTPVTNQETEHDQTSRASADHREGAVAEGVAAGPDGGAPTAA